MPRSILFCLKTNTSEDDLDRIQYFVDNLQQGDSGVNIFITDPYYINLLSTQQLIKRNTEVWIEGHGNPNDENIEDLHYTKWINQIVKTVHPDVKNNSYHEPLYIRLGSCFGAVNESSNRDSFSCLAAKFQYFLLEKYGINSIVSASPAFCAFGGNKFSLSSKFTRMLNAESLLEVQIGYDLQKKQQYMAIPGENQRFYRYGYDSLQNRDVEQAFDLVNKSCHVLCYDNTLLKKYIDLLYNNLDVLEKNFSWFFCNNLRKNINRLRSKRVKKTTTEYYNLVSIIFSNVEEIEREYQNYYGYDLMFFDAVNIFIKNKQKQFFLNNLYRSFMYNQVLHDIKNEALN